MGVLFRKTCVVAEKIHCLDIWSCIW